MPVNPEFVWTDPLFVDKGNAFLDELDFGQPSRPAKQGNLYAVFNQLTGKAFLCNLSHNPEIHVGRSN
jgi:hypothetical protein